MPEGLPSFNVDLGKLTDQVATLGPLIQILMILTGLIMVAWAIISLARGQTGQRMGGSGGTLAMLMIGGILTAVPILLDLGSNTIGASSSQAVQARADLLGGNAVDAGVFGNAGGGGSSGWTTAEGAKFGATVVAVIGLIGFFNGWLMLKKLARGEGAQAASLGKAMTLLIGGLLAINIPWTITMVANTYGASITW